jgi:hypothetical protein
MVTAPDLVSEAEAVAAVAQKQGISLCVIGAMALAAYQYVRTTADLDLAGNIPLDDLATFSEALKTNGYQTELRRPDAEDPLGGVLDIETPAGLIQVISFADRFPAVIQEGLQASDLVVRENSRLKIIPLAYLVVLKLYAGGLKSKADIYEVLSRNPDENLDRIEELCSKYRVRGFSEIRRELGR